MMKLQIKYQNEEDKQKIIKILSAEASIKSISKPYKSGQYYRIYVNIE